MRKRTILFFGLLLGAVSLLHAHDLFLKLESYFVEPGSTLVIPLLNGTFSESEGTVAPERVTEIGVVSPAGSTQLDASALSAEGNTSFLTIETEDPGTYVVGVSLRKRVLEIPAEDFNSYLEHDGIPDVLEARTRDGELDRDVRERYAKHVKAIFQVGGERSASFGAELGYPAEIVPLVNPYELAPGSELEVRCLVDGEPVANQIVIAGGENDQGSFEETATRTAEDGTARFTIDAPGKWYVKFIHMARVDDGEAEYESSWATLTFEVRADH